jgi:hypothetical protein
VADSDVLLDRGCSDRVAQLERQRAKAVRNLELLTHPLRDFRVLARSCGSLRINPLRIIHNLGAVEASMEVGGDEAGDITQRLLRRAGQEFDQLIIPLRLDLVGVDQGELTVVGDQLRHALVRCRPRLYGHVRGRTVSARKGRRSASSPSPMLRSLGFAGSRRVRDGSATARN